MADGTYIYEFTNSESKNLRVWTRDGVEFHLILTDMETLNSESIYLPGFDLGKSILKATWWDD